MTKTYSGLGLGLAIVKSLTALHGGSVRVKSGGEGKGSTFIVSLPISVVHTLDQAENRQRTKIEIEGPMLHTIDLKGIKVMVVDDEADAIGLPPHPALLRSLVPPGPVGWHSVRRHSFAYNSIPPCRALFGPKATPVCRSGM